MGSDALLDALDAMELGDDQDLKPAAANGAAGKRWRSRDQAPHSGATEGGGPAPGSTQGELRPAPVRFDFMDSARFAATVYRLDWHVKRLLVMGQPAVLGGPKKALKTSLLVDLALSLGTGRPFLGEFEVPQAVCVAMLSGESGEATLKDTAVRVAAAKGINLRSADVLWGFRLPQLADLTHLAALEEAIREHGVKVLIVDPLYLSLLSGVGSGGPQASNLYQIGPLLMAVSQTCLAAGCTPVLAHHFKTTRADHYAEPQLEDLAFAGIQEFARQWLLVGRRERYAVGTGQHRLWLSVGGSAGHSGLWAVDVDEGTVDEDFRGRTWNVSVATAAAVRREEENKREAAKREASAARDREHEAALLQALGQLDTDRQGAGYEQVRVAASLSRDRMARVVQRLKGQKVIEEKQVFVEIGKGGQRQVRGLKRRED